MRLSKLYAPQLKNKREEINLETPTYNLLEELSLVEYNSSGITTFLPLGTIVKRRLEDDIRNEMTKEGFQEIDLPLIQSLDPWKKSGRIDEFKDYLMYLKNLENFIMTPTNEEVIIQLLGKVSSYKELPLKLFQIAERFRDITPRRGIIRGKEFRMLESYSIHSDKDDLIKTCNVHEKIYRRVFHKLGLDVINLIKERGDYHDFIVRTKDGEDYFLSCDSDHIQEYKNTTKNCNVCDKHLKKENGLSIAMYMILDDNLSKKFNAKFMSKDGNLENFLMVAYGSGISRILHAVVDKHKTKKGIEWPDSIRPFDIGIIPISSEPEVWKKAEFIYDSLKNRRVLIDDREVSSVGSKIKTLDSIGVKEKIIIGPYEIKNNKITIQLKQGIPQEINENELWKVI